MVFVVRLFDYGFFSNPRNGGFAEESGAGFERAD